MKSASNRRRLLFRNVEEDNRSVENSPLIIQREESVDEEDIPRTGPQKVKHAFLKWIKVPRDFLILLAICVVIYSVLPSLIISQVWHLPQPVPAATANQTQFSAERALDVLQALSVGIGSRPTGSFNCQNRTVQLLVDLLVQLNSSSALYQSDPFISPVIEVEVQTATGAYRLGEVDGFEANIIAQAGSNPPLNTQQGWGGEETTWQYSDIVNVVARISSLPIEQRSTQSAVLISGHFDSVYTGPGASDDGLSISVMMELVRNIVNAKPTINSIVFNFNGAEETGLQGAHAFITQHPWAANVKAFINLDNMGNKGKEILYNSCFGSLVLTAYGNEAKYPFANVLGEDIFNLGLIPSDTDFHIYDKYGNIPGADIAFAMKSYDYHSAADTFANVDPGSVQHIGDNLLYTTLALANTSFILNNTEANDKLVYFDIFEWQMVIIEWKAQVGLSSALVGIIGIVLFSVFLWKFRHCNKRGQSVFWLFVFPVSLDFLSLIVSLVLSLVVPITIAAFLAELVDKPMSWYCNPPIAFILFAPPSIVAVLCVRWLIDWLHETKLPKPYVGEYEIIDDSQIPSSLVMLPDESYSIAVILLWCCLVVGALVANLGAVYIPTLFVGFCSAGLLLSFIVRIMNEKFDEDEDFDPFYNKYWYINLFISTIVPVSFLIYAFYIFTTVEIPTAGRSGFTFPSDIVIAVLVGVGVFLAITPVLPHTTHGKNYSKIILIFALLGIIALIIASQTDPYSTQCPKKLHLFHRYNVDTGRAAAGLSTMDPYPVSEMMSLLNAQTNVTGLTFNCTKSTCSVVSLAHGNFSLLGLSAPLATALSCKYHPSSGITNMTIQITHTGTQFSVLNFTTPSSIQSWSLTAVPPLPLPVHNSPPPPPPTPTPNQTYHDWLGRYDFLSGSGSSSGSSNDTGSGSGSSSNDTTGSDSGSGSGSYSDSGSGSGSSSNDTTGSGSGSGSYSDSGSGSSSGSANENPFNEYVNASRYFVVHTGGDDLPWTFWIAFGEGSNTNWCESNAILVTVAGTYIDAEVSPILSALYPILPNWTVVDSFNYYTYINLGKSWVLP